MFYSSDDSTCGEWAQELLRQTEVGGLPQLRPAALELAYRLRDVPEYPPVRAAHYLARLLVESPDPMAWPEAS